MISFATEFPVDGSHQASTFLDAVKEWLGGSPHTKFTRAELDKIGGEPEVIAQNDFEKFRTLNIQMDSYNEAVAVEYTRNENDLEWITTITFSRQPNDTWIGVRVSCESLRPTIDLPRAKKPIIVQKLMEKLGGGFDGPFAVTRAPILLKNDNIGLATRAIWGELQCHLPIVYVSAAFNGGHTVNVNSLALRLSGMAHILVEPNRAFSRRLKIETRSENAYGGAIGIYWPDGGGSRWLSFGRDLRSSEALQRAIFDEVVISLANRRALARCTLAVIQQAGSRKALDLLKASGSQEIQKYVDAFDGELEAKDIQLQESDREVHRLKSIIRKYESQPQMSSELNLATGKEQDFHPGEIREIILEALSTSNVIEGSRRDHVISEILSSNVRTTELTERREKLKKLLRDYRSMDGRTRRDLEEFGFSILEDGKHFKLTYLGDARYTFSLSKSGGDNRGGLNLVSDISKQLF
jgi:hypothetical protein